MEITPTEGSIFFSIFIIGYLYSMYLVFNTTKKCVKEQKNKKNYLVLKFKYSFRTDSLYNVLIEQNDVLEHGKLYYLNGLTIDHVKEYNTYAQYRIDMCSEGNIDIDDFLAIGDYIHNIMILSRHVGLIVPVCLEQNSFDKLIVIIERLVKGRPSIVTKLPTNVIVDIEESLITFKRYITHYCNHYSNLLQHINKLEEAIGKNRINKLTRP